MKQESPAFKPAEGQLAAFLMSSAGALGAVDPYLAKAVENLDVIRVSNWLKDHPGKLEESDAIWLARGLAEKQRYSKISNALSLIVGVGGGLLWAHVYAKEYTPFRKFLAYVGAPLIGRSIANFFFSPGNYSGSNAKHIIYMLIKDVDPKRLEQLHLSSSYYQL